MQYVFLADERRGLKSIITHRPWAPLREPNLTSLSDPNMAKLKLSCDVLPSALSDKHSACAIISNILSIVSLDIITQTHGQKMDSPGVKPCIDENKKT